MSELAKQRSPRYPVISLRDAVIKVTAVYRQDYRNKIPKTLVAEHMGYASLNGASLGVISAVSKYGLLEGGSEAMAVSERAVNIIEREFGDPDRVAAVRAAAGEPELFKDVTEAFPGPVSDSAIRSYLITKKGFLPDGASRFVEAYRETKEYVELEDRHGTEAALTQVAPVPFEPVLPEAKVASMQGQIAALRMAELEDGERELTAGILSKDANFRLLVSGKVGVKEIDRLIRKLELDKEILADEE